MIASEKKRGLCRHPFAGKHDWKDKIKAADLTKLGLIWAGTVHPSHPLCPAKTTTQIFLIPVVKESKIIMSTREKKKVLFGYPLLENVTGRI
jgi:hypothetical protein